MNRMGEWRKLCALLDGDEAVWRSVSAALERGDDGWEALLDGLDEAGSLAYLQVDDTGMELSDALVQLPRLTGTGVDLDGVTDTDDLGEATAVAHLALSGAGLGIVRLLEDDDAWPVVVVRASDVEAIAALVHGLGHEALVGG